MRLVRFVKQGLRKGRRPVVKKDDSNDLYDLVSLVETNDGAIEQSLTHQETENERFCESLETVLPCERSVDMGKGQASLDVSGSRDQEESFKDETVTSLVKTNDFILKDLKKAKLSDEQPVGAFQATESSLEVEEVIETPAENKNEVVNNNGRPITTEMSLPSSHSNKCSAETSSKKSDSVSVSRSRDFEIEVCIDEEYVSPEVLKEEKQRRFLQDLIKLSKKHIVLMNADNKTSVDILKDDEETVLTAMSTIPASKRDVGGLQLFHEYAMNVAKATTSVVKCGACSGENENENENDDIDNENEEEKETSPVYDEIALAIIQREQSIQDIVDELKNHELNMAKATSPCCSGRRKVIVDDDSTISTHMSMQLLTNDHY